MHTAKGSRYGCHTPVHPCLKHFHALSQMYEEGKYCTEEPAVRVRTIRLLVFSSELAERTPHSGFQFFSQHFDFLVLVKICQDPYCLK